MPICPANGHLIEDPTGPYCSRHGVPWFEHCSRCGAQWRTERQDPTNYLRVVGDEYCARCAAPAPWLSRADLIKWIRDMIRAAADVPETTRHELQDVLTRLQAMAPDDTKAVAGWQRIRDVAPKVWDATKPVRDALIGEAVKRALGI